MFYKIETFSKLHQFSLLLSFIYFYLYLKQAVKKQIGLLPIK